MQLNWKYVPAIAPMQCYMGRRPHRLRLPFAQKCSFAHCHLLLPGYYSKGANGI
jgi:hypothetical protein